MKIRGRISGQTILLDTLPGLPMDQRVEVDITPVEDTETEDPEDEDSPEPAQKRKRGHSQMTLHGHIPRRVGRPLSEPQFAHQTSRRTQEAGKIA